MEYDMDIRGVFLLLREYEYGYRGVFLFLVECDTDVKEFSCF